MVPRIHIETTGPDYGFRSEQYDALTTDLESQGVAVSIETALEQRSGVQAAREIAVYVKDFGGATLTVAAIAAALRKHLRGKRVGAASSIPIYGPDGREVLSRVELEEDAS